MSFKQYIPDEKDFVGLFTPVGKAGKKRVTNNAKPSPAECGSKPKSIKGGPEGKTTIPRAAPKAKSAKKNLSDKALGPLARNIEQRLQLAKLQ